MKFASTLLLKHFKLFNWLSLQTKEEEEHISRVPCASVVDSIMYDRVCIKLDILQVVSVVSHYMKCPSKVH